MSAIYEHAASLWREMHNAWEDLRDVEFDAAEDYCNGFMTTHDKWVWGVTNHEMWAKPRTYQRKHGSDELNEWLDMHPKTTLESFELQWMRGRVFA